MALNKGNDVCTFLISFYLDPWTVPKGLHGSGVTKKPQNPEHVTLPLSSLLVWCLLITRNFLYHLFFFALLGNHNRILYNHPSSLSHYSNNSKLCHISHQVLPLPSSQILSCCLLLSGVDTMGWKCSSIFRVSKTKVNSLKTYFTQPKPTLKSILTSQH